MYWQLTLALAAITGIIFAVRWFVIGADRRAMQEIDEICLGAESSHVSLIHDDRYHSGDAIPVHDDEGRLIGFVKERK